MRQPQCLTEANECCTPHLPMFLVLAGHLAALVVTKFHSNARCRMCHAAAAPSTAMPRDSAWGIAVSQCCISRMTQRQMFAWAVPKPQALSSSKQYPERLRTCCTTCKKPRLLPIDRGSDHMPRPQSGLFKLLIVIQQRAILLTPE